MTQTQTVYVQTISDKDTKTDSLCTDHVRQVIMSRAVPELPILLHQCVDEHGLVGPVEHIKVNVLTQVHRHSCMHIHL